MNVVYRDQSKNGRQFPTANGNRPAWRPATLTSFVIWAANAPAEKYALILWDHGKGVFGVNFDDVGKGTGQAADYLSVPGIAATRGDGGGGPLQRATYTAAETSKRNDLASRVRAFVGAVGSAPSAELVGVLQDARNAAAGFDRDAEFRDLGQFMAQIAADKRAPGTVTRAADIVAGILGTAVPGTNRAAGGGPAPPRSPTPWTTAAAGGSRPPRG